MIKLYFSNNKNLEITSDCDFNLDHFVQVLSFFQESFGKYFEEEEYKELQ